MANGYEINLNTSSKVTRNTGWLYDVADLTEPLLDHTEWFEIRIRAEGKRIQVWLKDKPVVDYFEPENPERKPTRKGVCSIQQVGLPPYRPMSPKVCGMCRRIS